MNLDEHRQQLTALQNKGYFNYGAQGPLPESALQAILKSYRHIQNLGPYSHSFRDEVAQELQQTREVIAAQLAVPASSITLTENVSVGCNIALWGIPWKAGDGLLLTDCEHPGIIAAAQEISRRFGVQLATCPVLETLNEGNPVEAIASRVQPNTKLVIISHILWNTGQVLRQKEIVEQVRSQNPNTQILVDAAQSVGSLPLTLTDDGIDFYAFTGHKWWCGPEGLGGLYVRPEALETLHPTYIGWRGILTTMTGQPKGWKPDGRRYEVATSAYPLLAGLREAISFHQSWGTIEQRSDRICKLSAILWDKLGDIPQVHRLQATKPQSGLVSFQLESGKHEQLVNALEAQNLMVRSIRHPNCIRACVHYFTEVGEIERLVEAIVTITSKV
ncbi:aminotransferase class V-fold PLP-dependent enzyme [Roseofilum reptotaenium CS-1145]|uniref:Cysteine lyase n=1 Tax=Roseofilum reptotaenium AO1-A TaxID=1925591 RepID=A0A1L9QPT2_9CYAN|nr:aminotransferase class V-fold PLP-dependent enzyme [Roseofilum reptotaenium]MDB9516631.1 aminotransferase class V-fold PLP-dependent enzyme [Roseofilum reptotaenium CS-1145]OJJ24674.1 cysteine lyase [Roseofilum reptotaenium AO1-A]